MEKEDRQLMQMIIDRLDRIEKALLGDPEHGMWGYNKRLSRTEENLSELADTYSKNHIKSKQEQSEIIEKMKADFNEKIDSAEKSMDKRVKKLEFAYMKRKGIEMTIAVFAGAIGSFLLDLLT